MRPSRISARKRRSRNWIVADSRGSHKRKTVMVLKQLRTRSSLEQYEKQAKELVKAYTSGDSKVMQCVRQHHPRLPGRANTNDRNKVTDSEIRSARVTFADAQSIVARWHGF